jgi:outer membrane protein TolC
MHWRRSRTVAAAVMMVMAAGVPASAAPFEVSDPELAAELAIEPLPGPDITLEAAIEAADKRNLTLRAARLELDRADAKLAQAWALVFPMATAGLNIVHADHADVVDFSKSLSEGLGPILEASGINLPPMESEPTVVRRQDTISGSITAAMSLVNVQSWYTISAARKGRDVARLTIESARQQLLAGVAQAYYLALMSRSLVEMQQNQVLSAAHHLDFATKRFDSGAGLRIDVVRAQTNLTEARQQLLGARLSLESARDALGVLTGSGDLPMPVAAADLPMPEGPDEKLVSWALKHRQDLAAGRASVVLADRQFGTSWAGFLPTFDMAWQGNYQFTEPSSLGSTDRSRWNLVFNLNVPIFQYFNIGALRDAKAAARIARLKLEDQRQAAGQEVRQARRDHEAAVASARLAEQQAELAREAMDLAQTAFEAGAGSSLEVTDARRTVTAAEVNRMTRLLQVQISRLVLHRALGTDVRDLVR